MTWLWTEQGSAALYTARGGTGCTQGRDFPLRNRTVPFFWSTSLPCSSSCWVLNMHETEGEFAHFHSAGEFGRSQEVMLGTKILPISADQRSHYSARQQLLAPDELGTILPVQQWFQLTPSAEEDLFFFPINIIIKFLEQIFEQKAVCSSWNNQRADFNWPSSANE